VRPSRWTLTHIPVSSSFFFSSLILSRRRLDVYHTTTHDVALVRIENAGLKCAARGLLKIQGAKIAKNSPPVQHRTNLSGYIFATKACVDNRKNWLNSNISSTCSQNIVNVGPLTAEIGSGVWGTPANFKSFASWLNRYCTDVQCNGRSQPNFTRCLALPMGWYTIYTFFFGGGALAPSRNYAMCKIHFASKSCIFLYWQRYCTALKQ